MPLARSALSNLEAAYELFAVVKENDRAKKVLVSYEYVSNRAFDTQCHGLFAACTAKVEAEGYVNYD